jgi:hypothetical protein
MEWMMGKKELIGLPHKWFSLSGEGDVTASITYM